MAFLAALRFLLVRPGSHREASSGCYTAMALLPLTTAGHELAAREQVRLARDLPPAFPLATGNVAPPVGTNDYDNDDDWLELAGFAFAHRPLSTSMGALHRLLYRSALPLAALRGQLTAGECEQTLCERLSLSGRKALLAQQRADAGQALYALDAQRTVTLKEQVQKLQFF